MESRLLSKKNWLALLLIVLVGLVAYSNSFHVPFVFDDEWTLVDNPDIRSLEGLQTSHARYIANLSFALNYHFGGYDVVGYHVVNLVIHLLAALLVYLLLRLTFRTPYFQGQGEGAGDACVAPASCRAATFIPLFAALLFVAHPIQTQAVTYIVQRMTSLATLFYLLSLVLYVLARLSMDRKSILKTVLLLTGAAGAALLAMKTKEITFTLPFAIVLYEVFFFRGNWKRRLISLLPLLAMLPIVPLMVLARGGSAGDLLSDIAEKTSVQTELPRLDYLFTQFRVIVTYLRLLILPVNQNVDYAYPVYRSFFSVPVLASFLLLVGLVLLAVYLFIRTRSSLPGTPPCTPKLDPLGRLISFGIFWFFLTLAVESSFIPIVDVIFEHRLYLPSTGAALVFATGFFLVLRKFPRSSGGRLIWPLTALLIISLTVGTFQRNQIWGDKLQLWQDVVSKSPDKGRPLNNLGVALEEAGRRSEAFEALSRSIQVSPYYFKAYYNLADLYLASGQPQAALPLLEAAIKMKPDFTAAYVKAGAALIRSKRFGDAAAFLERNLELVGGNGEAHFYLGAAYVFTGRREAALRELEIVTGLDPALAKDLAGLLGRGEGGMVPHGR